jgi:hypothetical protein
VVIGFDLAAQRSRSGAQSKPPAGGEVSMYDDQDAWPIKCAGCLHEFTKTVAELRSGRSIHCPACGCLHTYTSDDFDDALSRARQSLFDPWAKMLRLRREG